MHYDRVSELERLSWAPGTPFLAFDHTNFQQGGARMKKNTILGFLVFLTATFFQFGNGQAQEKPATIILESVYPPSHARLGEKTPLGTWLDLVEKNSKGMIKIERHWAGEPVPSKEALDGLSTGVLDMLIAFPPFYSGKIGIADVAAMPKNFKRFEDVFDLWWNSPLGEIIDKAYQRKFNAKFLFPAIFAPENFQVSKKSRKIRKFDDFKGMKIRAGGGALNETVKAIGGSPVQTVGGEYYTAMQRGIVDAGLMTTYSLETYKMWEVADVVVNPPIFNNCFVGVWMNLDKWKSLSPELQRLFIDTARQLEPQWIKFCKDDDIRIEDIAKKHGVEFYVLPPEEQAKMWEAVAPVWNDYVENCKKQGLGEEAKQIMEIMKKRFDSYK
jgi:TRAP-type C4-dicarboxylate transport system substrate-binding protein